jgi:CheY-like chemotaxis protein
MVDLFRRYLDGTAWQVISAGSGDQARKLLSETFPAVVILDVILPEEDGWEVLISLKSSPVTRAIPVIVCSAINEPQLMASLGAAAYLPKPVTRLSLLQALQPWGCPAASQAPGSPETHPAGG